VKEIKEKKKRNTHTVGPKAPSRWPTDTKTGQMNEWNAFIGLVFVSECSRVAATPNVWGQ